MIGSVISHCMLIEISDCSMDYFKLNGISAVQNHFNFFKSVMKLSISSIIKAMRQSHR